MPRHIVCATAGALAILLGIAPNGAFAQVTQDNVTTQSRDAFGSSIGNERTGLYTPDEVRGFSPIDAGNARIDGFYFDPVDRIAQRLIAGNTIRVGISAQGYPFPAPSGLVEFRIERPGNELALEGEIDNSGNIGITGLGLGGALTLPLLKDRATLRLSITGRDAHRIEGGEHQFRNMAAVLALKSGSGAQVHAFTSALINRDEEARPTLFPAGTALPPEPQRRRFLGQDWTDRNTTSRVHGLFGSTAPGRIVLEGGLFLATRDAPSQFSDLLLGVSPDGAVASRVIIADGNSFDRSLSGEVRARIGWQSGELRHRLILSLRARDRSRLFGGSRRIALGASQALLPDLRAAQSFNLGEKNRDTVRQLLPGISYGLERTDGSGIDASIAYSHYSKNVDFADGLIANTESRDSRLLWNLSARFPLTRRLTLFGGISRGLEDALIAPDVATNRSETPSAIATRQTEVGARLALAGGLSFVVIGFDLEKPYFNLDQTQRYRNLGTIRNTGVELSLAGSLAPGLSVVGGTVFARSRISGEAVDAGLIGGTPVASAVRRSVVSIDWRLNAGRSPLSFDLAWEGTSRRAANAANTLWAPGRNQVNLGARLRTSIAGADILFRPLILNLLDSYDWNVSPTGGFTYTVPRTLLLSLSADL